MISTIGDRIRIARKDAGLTQQALGKAVGVSKAAISQIEVGSTKSPAAATLLRISAATGFSSEWIINGKGQQKDPGPSKGRDLTDAELDSLWSELSSESKAYLANKIAGED